MIIKNKLSDCFIGEITPVRQRYLEDEISERVLIYHPDACVEVTLSKDALETSMTGAYQGVDDTVARHIHNMVNYICEHSIHLVSASSWRKRALRMEHEELLTALKAAMLYFDTLPLGQSTHIEQQVARDAFVSLHPRYLIERIEGK